MMFYRNDWMTALMVGGVILLGLIILVIYLLVRTAKKSDHAEGAGRNDYTGYSRTGSELDPNSGALAILAERYARGEISDEEYRQKKSEIMKP